ncbi:hypothetical protein F5Y17DRAFT_462495 [Xylariaceae sp. FL0594]|nr:hypothetical protein F5Y17DRAFT_462495 [Xylariaceae sp. FL0594]
MEEAFTVFLNTLVNRSILTIKLFRINNVTEDTMAVSLEALVSRTGQVSATISPMTVHLCSALGVFAEITLPVTNLKEGTGTILLENQMVQVVDRRPLKGFVKGVISGESGTLSLRNGKARVSALGVGPREFVYARNIKFYGLGGPTVTAKAASLVDNAGNIASSQTARTAEAAAAAAARRPGRRTSAAPIQLPAPSPTTGNFSYLFPVTMTYVNLTLSIINPSPLEISFGTCEFDIMNQRREVVAELKGRFDVRRNRFDFTLHGRVNRNVASKLAQDILDYNEDKKARETAMQFGLSSGISPWAGENQGENPDGFEGAPIPVARLVGKRCGAAGWLDEVIKNINVPIENMGVLFECLGMEYDPEEVQRLTPRDVAHFGGGGGGESSGDQGQSSAQGQAGQGRGGGRGGRGEGGMRVFGRRFGRNH